MPRSRSKYCFSCGPICKHKGHKLSKELFGSSPCWFTSNPKEHEFPNNQTGGTLCLSVDSKGTNKNATSRWNPLAEGQTLWEPPSSFRTLSTSTQKASWMCQVTIMFLLVRLSLPSLHPFLHSPLSLVHLSCRGPKAKRGGSEMGSS